MDAFRVLEIKKSVFENNDRQADLLREELKRNHTFLLNLMSSPGSGKTTTLMATINALKDDLRIGVMEADIDSDVDAATISTSGAKVIHPTAAFHTGRHLGCDHWLCAFQYLWTGTGYQYYWYLGYFPGYRCYFCGCGTHL